MTVLYVLIVLAVVATAAVLALGLVSMARGGSFDDRFSNRLMRLRVFTQGVAVALIGVALVIYVFGRTGGG